MDYFIKASIVIAIFLLFYALLLKRETFFQQNRWFLLVGLFVAVILPLIVIPIEIPVEPISYQYSFTPTESQAIIEQTSDKEQPVDWQSIALTVYGIGLVLFIVQFILQFSSLILLLLKNPKRKDGIYTYVIVRSNVSPFSFFKWIVYNPETMNDEEAQLMLAHEKVHVNQMHSIDIMLAQLACSIFWFNPLIWFYRNQIRQNLEYIADAQTQSITNDVKVYQKLLLKTSVTNSKLQLTNNFYNSLIKERIVMLQKSKSQARKQWRYLFILPLLVIVLTSMNTKEVYVEKQPSNLESFDINQNQEIEIIFTKTTTEAQFKQIEKELQSQGVTMNIRELKRNADGFISSINVEFKSKNGTSNYAVKKEEGISDFYFRMSKDGSFGVGSFNKREIVVIDEEKDITGDKIIIKEDNGKSYEVIVEEDDDTNVKVVNGKTFIIKKAKDNEVIIELDSLAPGKTWTDENNFTYEFDSSVDTIHVEKDVHVIKAPGNKFEYRIGGNEKGKDYDIEFIDSKSGKSPLFIINGEAKDKNTIKFLDTDNIKSMTVLKDESAVKIYGEKGKDGVILIETQGSIDDKSKSKWAISKVEVNSVSYIDDEDERKNATLAYITKYTPDDILDKNQALLEKEGITVKYSKIKRNKKGEITRIKIRVSNGKGSESSASWKNDEGIDGIEYGISEGTLIARTSKQSFNKN